MAKLWYTSMLESQDTGGGLRYCNLMRRRSTKLMYYTHLRNMKLAAIISFK